MHIRRLPEGRTALKTQLLEKKVLVVLRHIISIPSCGKTGERKFIKQLTNFHRGNCAVRQISFKVEKQPESQLTFKSKNVTLPQAATAMWSWRCVDWCEGCHAKAWNKHTTVCYEHANKRSPKVRKEDVFMFPNDWRQQDCVRVRACSPSTYTPSAKWNHPRMTKAS